MYVVVVTVVVRTPWRGGWLVGACLVLKAGEQPHDPPRRSSMLHALNGHVLRPHEALIIQVPINLFEF